MRDMGEHYCPNSSPRNPPNSGGGEELSNGPAERPATENLPNTVSVSPSSDPRADGAVGAIPDQGPVNPAAGRHLHNPSPNFDDDYQPHRAVWWIAGIALVWACVMAYHLITA